MYQGHKYDFCHPNYENLYSGQLSIPAKLYIPKHGRIGQVRLYCTSVPLLRYSLSHGFSITQSGLGSQMLIFI